MFQTLLTGGLLALTLLAPGVVRAQFPVQAAPWSRPAPQPAPQAPSVPGFYHPPGAPAVPMQPTQRTCYRQYIPGMGFRVHCY